MIVSNMDVFLEQVIIGVEMALHHRNIEVKIVGFKRNFPECNDKRIKFLYPSEMMEEWKKENSLLKRIVAKFKKSKTSIFEAKTLYIVSNITTLKVYPTSNSDMYFCTEERIVKLIERMNQNLVDGSSGYERYLLAMGKAMFGQK